jgi:hypothetical protein
MNNIRLSIRDVAGKIILNDPKMSFTISAVGLTTTLVSTNHGLTNGMLVYLDSKSNRKNTLPRIYTVTVVDPNTIEINADTTGLAYLVGANIILVIDDYVFNYNIKIYSIREDESTTIPNVR